MARVRVGGGRDEVEEVMAYANGTVVSPETPPSAHNQQQRERRTARKRAVHETMLLSSEQQLQRDRLVDAERIAIMSEVQGRPAETQVHKLCMEVRHRTGQTY